MRNLDDTALVVFYRVQSCNKWAQNYDLQVVAADIKLAAADINNMYTWNMSPTICTH